ncbi:MAG: hypothetical protein ACKOKH_05130, partial [Bacteroidota bacterium]
MSESKGRGRPRKVQAETVTEPVQVEPRRPGGRPPLDPAKRAILPEIETGPEPVIPEPEPETAPE